MIKDFRSMIEDVFLSYPYISISYRLFATDGLGGFGVYKNSRYRGAVIFYDDKLMINVFRGDSTNKNEYYYDQLNSNNINDVVKLFDGDIW